MALVIALAPMSYAQTRKETKAPTPLEKLWNSLTKRSPQKVQKRSAKQTRKAHKTLLPSPTPAPPEEKRAVDAQWIADYRQLELAWDYPIPDDDQIDFKDGKYYVPLVVAKHYEDMLNTAPRRAADRTR